MCGFHLLLTYLDCRSVHLSEILVVCGDCLGKYVYIEFFSKLGFNVRISGHLKTLRLKRRCKLVENLRIAGHFLNKSVGNLMCWPCIDIAARHMLVNLRADTLIVSWDSLLFLAPFLRASKSLHISYYGHHLTLNK